MARPKGSGIKPTANITCEWCGISVVVLRYEAKYRRFCSMACGHFGHRGTVGHWMGVKRPDMAEERKGKGNPAWKGDDVKYSGLHIWLRENYGNAGACEHCGVTKKLDWALKKGKTYKRRRSYFLHLCRSCHQKYDYASGVRTMEEERKRKISQALKGKRK
jgi:hypothetical protein